MLCDKVIFFLISQQTNVAVVKKKEHPHVEGEKGINNEGS
jgi:hypothetical protein